MTFPLKNEKSAENIYSVFLGVLNTHIKVLQRSSYCYLCDCITYNIVSITQRMIGI